MNSKPLFIFITLWIIVSFVLLDETTGFVGGDRRWRRRLENRRRRVAAKANSFPGVCIYIFCTTKCGRDAQNHLNIVLLNVFYYLDGRYRHIFIP